MSKPIRITDEMKQQAQNEFALLLGDLKMSDGKISYSKAFHYKKQTATLGVTTLAYSKMLALVTAFSDEVAWHGVVSRIKENEFLIEDVFVYPQEVTGNTVNTDQKRYTEWLYAFDDETFNKIRMQGHSHVHMGVAPSTVDNGHREKILEQLDDSMFYVFMVWNKSLKTHTLIYDMENNVLYDDKDVTVKIMGDASLEEFLADAGQKVQTRKAAAYKVKAKKGKKQEEPQIPLWDRLYGYGYGMPDPYDL